MRLHVTILRFKYDIDPLADSDTETYRYRSVKPFIHFPNHERAAEELGVSVRSYKRYEKAQNIAKLIELATFALSTKNDKGIG